ncbi:MAG: hypothetical protein LBT05_08900 [Planctomycetaceae bacterium]|nr:hypothetical protein [Planctomycetaceae bacterium]
MNIISPRAGFDCFRAAVSPLVTHDSAAARLFLRTRSRACVLRTYTIRRTFFGLRIKHSGLPDNFFGVPDNCKLIEIWKN